MTAAEDPRTAMRSYLQRVATGPELSKDISFEEAHAAVGYILDGKVDPVQAGVFLIALRMKRETDDENKGVLQAILDVADKVIVPVDEVLDIADPYDGRIRSLPVSPFLPAVLAACGVPAVCHGLESVGPKYGVTHRKVLRAAGIDVDLTPEEAAASVGDTEIGWTYIDQKAFCPKLHALVGLRNLIVKRPVITTVEVMVGPVRGRRRTHLMTGYVHKPYPAKYVVLARHAGFDSAMIVRGVEGGVIPSLQQPSKVFFYRDNAELRQRPVDPREVGIDQSARAVPMPDNLPTAEERGDEPTDMTSVDSAAQAAATAGMAALAGEVGLAYDSLLYGGAICLTHLKRQDSLQAAADTVRKVINSGEPLARFRAHQR